MNYTCNKILRAVRIYLLGMCSLHLVKYFHFSSMTAWKSSTVHFPTHQGSFLRPALLMLPPPSFTTHFNSFPSCKVSEQKARFQVQVSKPKDKNTWSTLCPRQLYTSTLYLQEPTATPWNASSLISLGWAPAMP